MCGLVPASALVALALSCLLGKAPLGQQKPAFKSGVEVVLLDVSVVDGSHVPVSDLKPEDFAVSVDRKNRKVVDAHFVRYDVRTAATTDRQIASVSAPGAARKAAIRPPARNLLIAIDTDSMEPGDGLLACREAANFVDRLAPDDRVAVVTIPRMQSTVTMTKNRAQAKAELTTVITGSDRHRSLQFSIGLAEAFDVERGYRDVLEKVIRRECKNDPGCGVDVRMEIRQMQIQAHLRAERSLDALRALAESLARLDGAKTLLYVTGGAPVPELTSMAAYSRLGTAFATAQISLYTLYVHQEQLFQAKYRPSPTALQDMDLERQGVENTTGAANGTMLEVVGAYDKYFDQILAELSASYLVGVEVQPSDRDGRPHYVSVSVNRKGVEVRARQQYVIEAAGRAPGGESPTTAVTAVVGRPPAPVVPANPARDLAATPPELQPLVERMEQYVKAYEQAFPALLCEERSEMRLLRWDVGRRRGKWTLAAQRRIAGESLFVKRGWGPGWDVARDVFEVDGQVVRAPDGRLRAMYLKAPDRILEQALTITTAAAGYDIGFVDRTTNVAIAPLTFLTADLRGHFVFVRQAVQVVAGIGASQIAFTEREEPAFVVSGRGWYVPVSGTLSVDPRSGAILKTVVRWQADGNTVEIAVTYAKAADGSVWVPADMVETYTAGWDRLECSTKFSHCLRLEVRRD